MKKVQNNTKKNKKSNGKPLPMYNILVTGGDGFLGKHLMMVLKAKGHVVTSYDILSGKDIFDSKQLDKAVKGKDIVFHLAAVADLNHARANPRLAVDLNIIGTANVVEACTKHKVVLNYISTCCVYGNQDVHPISEKNHPRPTELYAHTKLAGEQVILGYAAHFGLKYNILRVATFYGSEMRGALVQAVFLRKALKNEPLLIHGTGKQTRTYTHVADIVDGLVRVVDKGIINQIVNITSEEETSVLDLAKLAISITGSKSKLRFVKDREGQIYKEHHNTAKARKILGWEAKVALADGLKDLHEWIKNNPELENT